VVPAEALAGLPAGMVAGAALAPVLSRCGATARGPGGERGPWPVCTRR
jgi:hypothetical protein